MFSDVQTALVALLEAKRVEAESSGVAAGRLAPLVVKPYSGEFLRRDELVNLLPAVFVELDDGRLEAQNLSGSDYRGELPFDVICAVLNEAGADAAYSDGVALLTWTFEALKGEQLTLPSGLPVWWDAYRFRRIVAGGALWAYALTPNMKTDD